MAAAASSHGQRPQPAPYKPSEAERRFYYYGLIDLPVLIARTSTEPWDLPLSHNGTPAWEAEKKRLYPVGTSDVAARWSDEVRDLLVLALDGCNWTSFYPICIGYWPYKPKEGPILHVGIVPGSLSWEEGIDIAFRCRTVLVDHGITGVEVELRESEYVPLTTRPDTVFDRRLAKPQRNLDDAALTAANINEAMMPFLPYPGYQIRRQAGPAAGDAVKTGSMGLLVRLRGGAGTGTNADLTFGLTSRHVIQDGADTADIRTSKAKADKTSVMLGSSSAVDTALRRMPSESRLQQMVHKARIKRLKDAGPLEDEQDDPRLERLGRYRDDVIDAISQLKVHNIRIGHVAFSPSSGVVKPGMFRDWALVQLSPNWGSPDKDNRVYVGTSGWYKANGPGGMDNTREGALDPESLDDYGFLRLHGIVPLQRGTGASHQVLKRGATTGLTVGFTNEVEAVVRRSYTDGTTVIAWHWLVLAAPEYSGFSAGGDSGACVFDFEGRVIGLVDAGTQYNELGRFGKQYTDEDPELPAKEARPLNPDEIPEEYDVVRTSNNLRQNVDATFVTPIQWILDDIREYTGCEAEIA